MAVSRPTIVSLPSTVFHQNTKVRSAPRRFASVRSAPTRFAPTRSAALRFAPVRFAPPRSATSRFAPARTTSSSLWSSVPGSGCASQRPAG